MYQQSLGNGPMLLLISGIALAFGWLYVSDPSLAYDICQSRSATDWAVLGGVVLAGVVAVGLISTLMQTIGLLLRGLLSLAIIALVVVLLVAYMAPAPTATTPLANAVLEEPASTVLLPVGEIQEEDATNPTSSESPEHDWSRALDAVQQAARRSLSQVQQRGEVTVIAPREAPTFQVPTTQAQPTEADSTVAVRNWWQNTGEGE